MGRKMGVFIDHTPKCHCEMAGEGIEYSSGCAKNAYSTKPISDKGVNETNRSTVRTCISWEVIIKE
jgi:hypothetical protein